MTGPSGRVVPLALVALLLLYGIVSTSALTLRDDEQHFFAFLRNVLPEYPSPFNTSVPTCQWQGLSCIGLGAQQRIKGLSLGGLGLNGSIPYNTLGALTALTYLDLSGNLLSGDIPWDIWVLPNLVHLGLANNKLTGALPAWVNLFQLQELNLSGNLFSGAIPDSFSVNLRYLMLLDLHGNNFSGPMPALTNKPFLRYLDLSSNQFTGGVANATFYIQDLLTVNLSRNLFTGPIPQEFGWLYKLRSIDLSENNFEGAILDPYNLVHLREFYVSSNQLYGSLPFNFTTLPYLQALGVANNKLWGSLPPLSSNQLKFLDCSNNFLSGSIPWDLLASENLAVVRLAGNSFTGSIPTNVTTQMVEMDLGSNNFTGDIPATFTSSHSLEKLDVSSNQLNGSIPWGSITELHSLRYLNLAYNRFAPGGLPNFSQFVNLTYLNLSSSYVNGSIPDSVGELRSLMQLDLSHNQVTGNIPTNLSQTINLISLDLSHNNLSGQIPPELVSLMSLSTLDLSYNNLSGEVPSANQWVHFSNSSYVGNPLLCGVIMNKVCPTNASASAPSPTASILVAAPSLAPSSIIVVPSILHRHASNLKAGAIVGILFGISLAICAFLSTYVLFHKKVTYKKKPKKQSSSYLTGPVTFEADPCLWASQVPHPASIPVIMFEKPLLNLTFADLLQATNKFHKDSQISDGRYGPTFKGVLAAGLQIVVKVLYDGGPANELEKAAQLEAIGKIRHENLVMLLGYCLVGEERLLVYEFMENGDVHQRLHDSLDEMHPENWVKETWADAPEKFISEDLGWPIRHRIAVGVARALAFLHHGCVPKVVHRDVTSSNILLDSQFEPHLADCGLAELVESGKQYEMDLTVTGTMMSGNPGYVPPEYGQTWKATDRGDVYSFGVVLLELVTGKKPTGDYFHESFGGNLVSWVRTLIREKRGYKCLDPKLVSAVNESEMLEFLRIGYLCTAELPAKRPTMQQVVGLLKDIHVDIVTCM